MCGSIISECKKVKYTSAGSHFDFFYLYSPHPTSEAGSNKMNNFDNSTPLTKYYNFYHLIRHTLICKKNI